MYVSEQPLSRKWKEGKTTLLIYLGPTCTRDQVTKGAQIPSTRNGTGNLQAHCESKISDMFSA